MPCCHGAISPSPVILPDRGCAIGSTTLAIAITVSAPSIISSSVYVEQWARHSRWIPTYCHQFRTRMRSTPPPSSLILWPAWYIIWKLLPDDYHTALLFLSTIYGLRSIEMSQDSRQPIQLHLPGSFTMAVAKRHGRGDKPVIREHLIPEGMDKYLTGFTLMSKRSVEYAYRPVARAIGYKPSEHESWHAIRRSLDTACVDADIPTTLIKRFMRWSKSRADMPSIYYHTDFADVNTKMFEVHPYLPLWE